MDEIQSLLHGFAIALSLKNVALMFVGIVLGVIIGVLPGLGGANGVAILLPLTFSMAQSPGGTTSAIILLSCIYWGALFGGAITSILFNIPGEPWSVATTFDGYPLAQQGRAGSALTAAFTSSFVGALVAVIVITFLSPVVASFALEFGAPEFFAVYLLTFCAFVGMSKEPPFKTIASMMLGFALAAVGTDPVTGTLRLTFGSTALLTGFDFLVAVIGLFGIGEILLTLEEGLAFKGASAKINLRVVLDTWKELPRYWLTSIRSSAVGVFMGIVPGGATPASFMSYGVARRFLARRRQVRHRQGRGRGRSRDRGARRGHFRAAADAHARRAGLAHRGGAARRPAHLGPAARAAAVRRAEGFRLGPDRLDVPRQHRRPDRGADLRAALRRHPAHSVLGDRADHHRHLRDRLLHGAQLDVRRLDDAGVRRRGIRVQEA
jgi:TctA family transporter